MSSNISRSICILALLMLLFLGWNQRSSNIIDEVFPEDKEATLWGVDPYYFLRHTEFTFKNFPSLMKEDHATHFPQGTLADAGGLYTIGLAALCKTSMTQWNEQTAIKLLAWVPVVLGVISMILVFVIGRLITNYWGGLVCTIIYFLYPGLSLPRTALGFPDHHAVEIVLVLAILMGVIVLLNESFNRVFRPTQTIAISLPLALSWTLWPGAPLYYALAMLSVALYLIIRVVNEDELTNTMKHFAIFFLTICLVPIVIVQGWPSLITVPESTFANVYLTVIGALLGGFCSIGFLFLLNSKWLNRKVLNLVSRVVAIPFGALVIYILIASTDAGKHLMGFINTKAYVSETSNFSLTSVYYLFGAVSVTFVFGVIVTVVKALFMHGAERGAILVLTFASLLFAYWSYSGDLGYLISPLLCITAGILVMNLSTVEDLKNQPLPQIVKGLILPIFCILILAIPRLYSKSYVIPDGFGFSALVYSDAWKDAADWLANNSPELDYDINKLMDDGRSNVTRDSLDYGVMTGWDYGNIINQRGKRIPVWSRWPGNVDSRWLTCTDELESLRLICPNCKDGQKVKYAVINSKMAGQHFNTKMQESGIDVAQCAEYKAIYPNNQEVQVVTFGDCFKESMAYKLYYLNAQKEQHYRLVWQSDQEVLAGYVLSGNQVNINDFQVNQHIKDQISDQNPDYINVPSGLCFDYILTSEIKIFEVTY